MGRVTATLTVGFQAPDTTPDTPGAALKLEWDSREGGNNSEYKGGPYPLGYSPAFLLFRSLNVSGLRFGQTAGEIAYVKTEVLAKGPEPLVWVPGDQTKTLAYPVHGGLSLEWIGASLGTPELQADDVTLRLPAKVPDGAVGVLIASYNTVAEVRRLTGLSSMVTQAAIYCVGEFQ